MSFARSIAELSEFAKRADATGDMRISISFKNDGDRARFMSELQREFEPVLIHTSEKLIGYSEMQLHGIRIRIL